jgi:hypothetical protein
MGGLYAIGKRNGIECYRDDSEYNDGVFPCFLWDGSFSKRIKVTLFEHLKNQAIA